MVSERDSTKEMSAREEKTALVEPLTVENYEEWKYKIKALFVTKGLWKAVAPKENERVSQDLNERAIAFLTLYVSQNFLPMVVEVETAEEAWNNLAQHFLGKRTAKRLHLRKEFVSLKKEEKEDVSSYILRARRLQTNINAIEENTITDSNLIDTILSGLPRDFDLTVNILATTQNLDVDTMATHLMHAEALLQKETENKPRVLAFTARKNKYSNVQKLRPKCYHCGKLGHLKKNCWLLRSTTRNDSNTIALSAVEDKQNGCLAELPTNSWIIDSGATAHMTPYQDKFENIEKLNAPISVTLGNGQELIAEMAGSIQLTKDVKLENVLYCPELDTNLLSVKAATENGCRGYFEKAGFCLWKGKQKVLYGKRMNGLYIFYPTQEYGLISSTPMATHRKFAHAGKAQMQNLKQHVNGLGKVSKFDEECDVCIQAKQGRKMQPKTSSYHASTKVLQLLHMDVMGPITPTGLDEEKYIITVLDDYSKLALATSTCSKGAVTEIVVDTVSLLENQVGEKVKTIRTDNGTEFVNGLLSGFMRQKGIMHQTSAPYSPQQNGSAERLNRTLMEKVRAVLIDSQLSKTLWPFALNYVVHTRNRTPCKPHNKTPYEMFMGQKPDVSHFQIFGNACYVLKPEHKVRSKLEPRSEKGIFVGYVNGSKNTYYILVGGNLIESKNVRFTDSSNERHMLPECNETQNISGAGVNHIDSDGCEDEEHEQQLQNENTFERDMQMEQETDLSRRYPSRQRSTPKEWYVATLAVKEPVTYEDAVSGPDALLWIQAMNEEIKSLNELQTYDVCPRPLNVKPLPCKWVFKIKRDQHGNIVRYKARLVAKGFKQKLGIDYSDTFAPVAKHTTLRLFLTVVATHDLELEQLDIKTAFLYGELQEKLYMNMPPGYQQPGKVCKLKRSLYGLKQAPRSWHQRLCRELLKLRFTQSKADPGLYIGEKGIYMIVYVDDLLLAGKDITDLNHIKQSLLQIFDGRDLNSAEVFLGLEITRDRENRKLFLAQSSYCKSTLGKFNMSDSNPVAVPMNTGTKLTKDPQEDLAEYPYQELVGSLLYLAVCTRPDISYAVGVLSRYMSCGQDQHVQAAKHVLKYLKGTHLFGITLGAHCDQDLQLTGFCDADYAGNVDSRKSTTGFVFTLNGSVISWQSKLQPTVAMSTTEAEYMAAATAAKEGLFLRKLLMEFGMVVPPVTIFCDNTSAIALMKDPMATMRSKHIDTIHHFLRERVMRSEVIIQYCKTQDQLADFLTKPLASLKFNQNIQGLHIGGQKSVGNEGEC